MSETKEACPITAAKQYQGTGTEVLNSTPNKPTPIPSFQTICEEGMKDLLRSLNRLYQTQDAAAAKKAITQSLNTGWFEVPRIELIRAIEARLPAPSAHQLDRCNLIRHTTDNTISYSRVIGAFGDLVLILTENPLTFLPPIVRVMSVPVCGSAEAPVWDTHRPTRRTWQAPIIDADTLQAEQPPKNPVSQAEVIVA